jgi:hypothetical protein
MLYIVRTVTTIFLLTFSLFGTAIATEKEQDLQRLMKSMDVSKMPSQTAKIMIDQVIGFERRRNPTISTSEEKIITSVINDLILKHAPELFEKLTPLFGKYYTHSEIKELIVFFESPIGKKYNKVSLLMTLEIMPIAQEWGVKIGIEAANKVENELSKLGYK